MQGLNLQALEIFRAVAQEGSVSKAAARLNRVQSNVSTRLRQLEDQLGRPLFWRRNRRLTLTPDGETLFAYSERFAQLSMEVSDALNSNAPRGTFAIGAMESTAAARLPAVLSRYHARYPDVEITLVTDTAGGLAERLRKGGIEAAFLAEPVPLEGVETQAVFTEELVLVAPKSYPALPDWRALSGRTVVAFEPGCAYRRHLEGWLTREGVMPGTILSVGSYLAILACVSAGMGYAIVPQSVLDVVASDGAFQRHSLPAPLSAITTRLIWRAGYQAQKLEGLRALLPDIGAA